MLEKCYYFLISLSYKSSYILSSNYNCHEVSIGILNIKYFWKFQKDDMLLYNEKYNCQKVQLPLGDLAENLFKGSLGEVKFKKNL